VHKDAFDKALQKTSCSQYLQGVVRCLPKQLATFSFLFQSLALEKKVLKPLE